MALSTSYICAIIVFNGKETLFFIWDWHHNLVYLNSNYNFKLQHFNIPCTPMDKDKRSIFNNVLFIFNNKFMNENFFSQQTDQDQFYIVNKLLINCPRFAQQLFLFFLKMYIWIFIKKLCIKKCFITSQFKNLILTLNGNKTNTRTKDSNKKNLHLMHKAITVDVRTGNNRFSAIL